MIKFTNFRTKALALVAMTAFSVGSVFGQAPFFGSTSPTTGPKMLQWNNQTKIDAPVNAGDLAQGVKVTFSGSETNNPFVAVSPAVAITTTIPLRGIFLTTTTITTTCAKSCPVRLLPMRTMPLTASVTKWGCFCTI